MEKFIIIGYPVKDWFMPPEESSFNNHEKVVKDAIFIAPSEIEIHALLRLQQERIAGIVPGICQ